MSTGGWVKNKCSRCHPPPGMGRIGQEPTSGCAAWLPGRHVTICQAGRGQKSYGCWGWGDRTHRSQSIAAPAPGAPWEGGGGAARGGGAMR